MRGANYMGHKFKEKNKPKKKKSSISNIQKANRLHIIPRNKNQRIYLNSLVPNSQVFALGPAGTGKTYLGACVASKLFLEGKIKKIIITRPRVEVDEEWGALPGTLMKKTAPWAYPVIEILEECMGKQMVEEAQRNGDIEVLPLAFMRGRTLQDAFCILDEAQNTTENQMKMFVTRIGENSTILINGDVAQTDIKAGSGLAWALSMLKKHDFLPALLIEFGVDDVERSAACAAWVKVINKELAFSED